MHLHFILPHGNIDDSLTDKLLTTDQYRENLRVSERAERASLENFRIHKYPNSYIFQCLSLYLRIIWHVSRLLCYICTFNAVSLFIIGVYNDLLLTIDKGLEAILLLLDYSAAFDTICHDTLLRRLHIRFGFCGTALRWLESYITGRSQSVVIEGQASARCLLRRGVPQGSVLGPVLFTMYSSPVEDLITSFGFGHAIYADDTQIYATGKQGDWPVIIPKLEECLHAIADWSSANGLSINEGKTELLHICSRFRTRSSLPPITFNKSILHPTRCARNLGVLFDNQLTLTDHINSICRAASFGLYKIGSIRRYLDQSATERLIHAFVMSRIDNCNGLLYGLSDLLLGRLQRIQNSAARLVTRTRSHESISPILHTLHWLPVKDRLVFKLLIIAYKCQHHLAPHYLQQLLQEYQPSRLLRSSTKQLLTPHNVVTKSYGQRSFQYSMPHLWNQLPDDIRECSSLDQFKSLLKSHLFVK